MEASPCKCGNPQPQFRTQKPFGRTADPGGAIHKSFTEWLQNVHFLPGALRYNEITVREAKLSRLSDSKSSGIARAYRQFSFSFSFLFSLFFQKNCRPSRTGGFFHIYIYIYICKSSKLYPGNRTQVTGKLRPRRLSPPGQSAGPSAPPAGRRRCPAYRR